MTFDLEDLQNYLKKFPEKYHWNAGETVISKMRQSNAASFKNLFGLAIASAPPKPFALNSSGTGTDPLIDYSNVPEAHDWRNFQGKNWVTSILFQNPCGSCVSFGTVAAFESALLIQYYKDAEHSLERLSEGYLHFCLGENQCEQGWYMSYALDKIKQRGIVPEDNFPYSYAWQNFYNGIKFPKCKDKCQFKACENQDLIKNTKNFDWEHIYNNIEEMKAKLFTYGPQSTGMQVWTDFFDYTDGVYRHSEIPGNNMEGYHCVCVVGYKDDPSLAGGGYWICKNSWDTRWGENGFFRIEYDDCEIIETGFFCIKMLAEPISNEVQNIFEAITKVYYIKEFEDVGNSLETIVSKCKSDKNYKFGVNHALNEIINNNLEGNLEKFSKYFTIEILTEKIDLMIDYLNQ